MGYTRNDILNKCEEYIKDVKTFYQQDIVNYRGKTTDTEEYYTEVIAEYICKHIESFKNDIPMITRKASYKMESHIGDVPVSNREEEIIAIKMFNQSDKEGYVYQFIGKIIDYQTPLKSVQTDIAGKVDLLSYDGHTLHILELKKPDSAETMLRCILEGYTYLQTVDKEKLLQNFSLSEDTVVEANPFVFFNSEQHNEMKSERIWLKKIMLLLNSKVYYIKEENEIFDVWEG